MRTVRRCLIFTIASCLAVTTASRPNPVSAQVVLGLPDEPSDKGTKLQPSTEVRAGMRTIRQRVLDAHSLITHRRMPRQGALQLRSDLFRTADALKGQADAAPALQEILALVVTGASEIGEPTAPDAQFEGLSKLETALERYPLVFEDPDWQPLR